MRENFVGKLSAYLVSAFLLVAAMLADGPLYAVPPGPGIDKPGNTCFINRNGVEKRLVALKAARQRGLPLAPPSKSQYHVLVIRVSFPDRSMRNELPTTQAFFERLRTFYFENSYTVFAPTFTITNTGDPLTKGTYVLPNAMPYYGEDAGADVGAGDQALFNDAVAAANAAGIDFTQFDQIMVYHAGTGQETSGLTRDIWSVYYPTDQTVDGKVFEGFTVVPDKEAGIYDPLGVICHEYGHQIGLPDLYDTSQSGGLSTVGAWDVMDYPYTGALSQDGSNPPHLGAWSKKFLGFGSIASPQEVLSLLPSETNSGAFRRIPVPSGSDSEYFLVEYRLQSSAAAYDKGLPMNGLAIWHVDDAVALDEYVLMQNIVNAPALNGAGHRGVDLVEADGTEPNTRLAIPDLGEGNAFGDGATFTAPLSNSFNGAQTAITITNITGANTGQLSGRLISYRAAQELAILKTTNYPNPGGDTTKYPIRPGAPAGTVTTLVMQLSKPLPVQNVELDIYTLNGERVRSIAGNDIALKVGTGEPSADNKWVYEYDWNGRNDSGEVAVSGVYLYRFKADRNMKVGKMMLVR